MYISLQLALNGGGDRAKKYTAGLMLMLYIMIIYHILWYYDKLANYYYKLLLTFLMVSYARVLEAIQDQADKRVI